VILTYHKVDLMTPTAWWIGADTFWKQMEQLTRFHVVPLDKYDASNPRNVVITFDGVYEGIYRYALPILKKFSYPFEAFIVGECIGKDNAFDQAVEPPARFASPEQLCALVQAGGRLQWHSRSHQDLIVLSPEKLREELSVPDCIRELDPQGFKWFAYPYGNSSPQVNAEVKKVFHGALACDEGNPADRYQLPRVTVTAETSFAKSTVSLIIANYNYGRFAADAIESVLSQTVPPKEIVFIDDCSEDTSMDVVSRYKDRVRIVRNDSNLGVVDNFNKAVSLTTGDYICFLGADNRFRSDYVEKCQRLLDQYPHVGVVYTDMLLFGPRAELLGREVGAVPLAAAPELFAWRCPDFDQAAKTRLASSNFIHGSSMYRREAFLQVGGYLKTDKPEDHHLFLRMVNAGWEAFRCPELLLEYRQHSNEQANVQLNLGLELAYLRSQVRGLTEENVQLREVLRGIYASSGWEMLSLLYRWRSRLAPEGTRRKWMYERVIGGVRRLIG
jgi:GT2 family glycosyltransferase